MRFVAPARASINPVVFEQPPLSLWSEFGELLRGTQWPPVAALNELRSTMDGTAMRLDEGLSRARGIDVAPAPQFVVQSPDLLRDGLHYEQRIAQRGEVATREHNWHDLLNALVWLRFPQLKAALNARQVAEIDIAGPKTRTRPQCALTLFDEAGVIVLLRDPTLLELWDRHDWHGLFWRERSAWSDGRIGVTVFGHAILEHALTVRQMLVGKAVAVALPQSVEREMCASGGDAAATAKVAAAIRSTRLLTDPQELRPLPLSGIPAWHPDNGAESFYREAPCFRPLRNGRCYPKPFDASTATRKRTPLPVSSIDGERGWGQGQGVE